MLPQHAQSSPYQSPYRIDTLGQAGANCAAKVREGDMKLRTLGLTLALAAAGVIPLGGIALGEINALYHFPNVVKGNGFVSKMLNGWFMSSIVSIQSGQPFSPLVGNNRSNSLVLQGQQ